MDGNNGSSVFTDSGPLRLPMTRFSGAQISTAQFKWGGASGLFNGTTDWVRVDDSSGAFDFGAGDFTMEAWVRPTILSGSQVICSLWTTDLGGSFRFGIDGTKVSFTFRNVAGQYRQLQGTIALSTNVWTHIAVVKTAGAFSAFVNGVKGGVLSLNEAIQASSGSLNIGRAEYVNTWWFKGNIDDLRITKGNARYTANFTPPIAPFPDA